MDVRHGIRKCVQPFRTGLTAGRRGIELGDAGGGSGAEDESQGKEEHFAGTGFWE